MAVIIGFDGLDGLTGLLKAAPGDGPRVRA
jgi:hypothetical protein